MLNYHLDHQELSIPHHQLLQVLLVDDLFHKDETYTESLVKLSLYEDQMNVIN